MKGSSVVVVVVVLGGGDAVGLALKQSKGSDRRPIWAQV